MLSHYLSVGKLSEFPEGRMRAYQLDRQAVAIACIGGVYFAFSNVCTHQAEHLTDGFIIDGKIVCAYHEATFDPADGAVIYGPALDPLPTYPVRVNEDSLQIEWPELLSPSAVRCVDEEEAERRRNERPFVV